MQTIKLFAILTFAAICANAQAIGARMEQIYAPLLTEEIRQSRTIPSPAQYIFFDPDIGKYVARYIPEKDGVLEGDPVIIPIRFRMETAVTADVEIQPSQGKYAYTWITHNGESAKYPVITVAFALPRMDQELRCEAPLGYPPVIIQSQGPTAARQIAESPAISRLSLGDWRFAIASYPDSQLPPGHSGGGWSCVSNFLPGLITAFAGGGADTILPNAPFAVHEELSKIRTYERYFQPALTFGPKYPPEAPPLIIALDYLHGLGVMASMGNLDRSGAFFRSLQTYLQQVVAEEEVAKLEGLRAETKFERELLGALRMALPKYF
jgi:hypothetical protein